MKTNICKITVVGGLPMPIGGVTSFVSRLAALNMISEILDLYPSPTKIIPENYNGRIEFLDGPLAFLFYYWRRLSCWSGTLIHFNFSRAWSVLIFLLLPKWRVRFALMLHHGELKVLSFRFLYKIAFSKVDLFFYMTDLQKEFYESFSVPSHKLLHVSSYVLPSFCLKDEQIRSDINMFFDGAKVFVASGYPSAIYNHDWCVRYVSEVPEYKLALFLYGAGEEMERLTEITSQCERIKIFKGYDQQSFNYALGKACLYLRPTSRDSFGIAVADALELGVKVLASDVCKRYPGAYLFSTGDYKSFSDCIGKILRGENVRVEETDGFSSFDYPDLSLL